MTPYKDPLYRSILTGLLASGTHPDTAIERALHMYRYIRQTQAPERPPYGAAILIALGAALAAVIHLLLR